MIPTREEIDAYFNAVEEYVFASVAYATSDLPNIKDTIYRFWEDVSRYGPSGLPSIRDVHVPGLRDFQIPPPPPPVPPKSKLETSLDWMANNPWKTSSIAIGIVGVGLLAGYSASRRRYVKVTRLKAIAREKRQVVVVLGADHPLGLQLVISLEKQGYIVIASVSSPDAVDVVERSCHGYVRALVLDPSESDTIPIFLRSLSSTLSRRFPLASAGDPHASPSAHPYIQSVISLLTIPSPSSNAPLAPLEHLSLRDTYLPYLQATHIAPLQVIQALLPLLRTTPARARDSTTNGNGNKTIVICLPAADARVGLPFASVHAMSAAATLRGAQVLSREIKAAALTDKSESMKNIKVVIVDVGLVDVNVSPPSSSKPDSAVPGYKAMDNWTASEKLTYGPAFASILPPAATIPSRTTRPASRWRAFWCIFSGSRPFGVRRKPTDIAVFVDTLVAIVSTGGRRASLSSVFGIGLGLERIRNCCRGDRFVVGAGAATYRCASHLPAWILDGILNIPHLLISIRNALLPVPPALPPAETNSPPTPPTEQLQLQTDDVTFDRDVEHSETGSEAEVESGLGEEPPNNSWISLTAQETPS